MTVHLVRRRDAHPVAQLTLWRVAKGGRVAECRARLLPIGAGLAESRVFMSRDERRRWHALAQMEQREFEVRRWSREPEDSPQCEPVVAADR